MKTIAITELTEIEAIIRKCPYCTVGITDLEGNPYVVPMNFCLQGRNYLSALQSRRQQSNDGRKTSSCLHHLLRRTRVGVYAPASGMQLQHEVAQRDMPRKRPFHRRYG